MVAEAEHGRLKRTVAHKMTVLKSSGCTLKFSAMAAKMSPIRSFGKMQKTARPALSGLLRLAVEQENKKNRKHFSIGLSPWAEPWGPDPC